MKNTLLILALLFAQSASALQLNFKSGAIWGKELEYSAAKIGQGYSEDKALFVYVNPHEASFEFINQGSRIVLADLRHDITFVVDLNNSREQDISSQYLDYLKKQSRFKDFAKVIGRITISDLQSAKIAGSDKIIGKVNYYINYRLLSGTVLKAKLQVSVSLETEKRFVRQFVDSNGSPTIDGDTGTGEARIIQAEVLVGSVTGNARVVSVDMGNSVTNMVVKSVLEMVLNIAPDTYQGSSVMFRSEGY